MYRKGRPLLTCLLDMCYLFNRKKDLTFLNFSDTVYLCSKRGVAGYVFQIMKGRSRAPITILPHPPSWRLAPLLVFALSISDFASAVNLDGRFLIQATEY